MQYKIYRTLQRLSNILNTRSFSVASQCWFWWSYQYLIVYIVIMDLDLEETIEHAEDEDEEEVVMTPAELIEMMQEAWLNEKFAPEILPNKSEVVECFLNQLTYMEENLQNLDSSDIKKGIHQLEVERLRFLVTSYLRTRLMKIEMYVFHILKQEAERAAKGEEQYLTQSEMKYAHEYKENIEQHLEGVLSFHPNLPLDQWKNNPVAPNTHSFVFVRSKTEVQGIVIDEATGANDDLVDVSKGSQILISYHSVADLVKSGAVHLI